MITTFVFDENELNERARVTQEESLTIPQARTLAPSHPTVNLTPIFWTSKVPTLPVQCRMPVDGRKL